MPRRCACSSSSSPHAREEQEKVVNLHTKGAEHEIAEALRRFETRPLHRDDLALQMSRAFERERPWHPHWPTHWSL